MGELEVMSRSIACAAAASEVDAWTDVGWLKRQEK
jgi:hypothetical protein